MIPSQYIDQWGQTVPWSDKYQLEKDLILSRALVSLYSNPIIYDKLIFRGGTALNKAYFNPPSRFSEDIDLVQLIAEPAGIIMDEIRKSLQWLGEPTRKQTKNSVKFFYPYTSIDGNKTKLKIEINVREHINFLDLNAIDFNISNGWFSGNTKLHIYQLDELIATKVRALYQRKKGRDLFDMYYVLKNNLINPDIVVKIFEKYCEYNNDIITRAMFEESMYYKMLDENYINDMNALLIGDVKWSAQEALDLLNQNIIKKLSGESWRGIED